MHETERAAGLSLGGLVAVRVVLVGSWGGFGGILGYLGSPRGRRIILYYIILYYLIASRIPPGQIRYMNEDPKMHGVEKAGGLSFGETGGRLVWGSFAAVLVRFWGILGA